MFDIEIPLVYNDTVSHYVKKCLMIHFIRKILKFRTGISLFMRKNQKRKIFMKKLITIMLMLLCLLGLTACSEASFTNLQDGTYRAEYKNFDVYGWKDYIEVTVVDGEITELVFDAVNMDNGSLKSESESYKKQMEPIVGTYPAKYNADLINQFLESGKISAVDVVAGATQSTGSFKTLLTNIVPNIKAGNTETVLVDDFVTEK